jgi:hypothetical protein
MRLEVWKAQSELASYLFLAEGHFSSYLCSQSCQDALCVSQKKKKIVKIDENLRKRNHSFLEYLKKP